MCPTVKIKPAISESYGFMLGEERVMCNLYRNVGDVFRGMTSSIGG